jgi:integrase
MGVTVRQKVRGRGQPYWVFVALNGKRTSTRVGEKKDADKLKKEIEKKIRKGEFRLGDPEERKIGITFKQYADVWMKTTVPATCKRSTESDYEAILKNHIRPVFDKMSLQDITRGKIKTLLLEKINQGYAKSTVKHIRNVISGILNNAVDDDLIHSNPALGLKRVFPKTDNKESINPLTPEELQHLLDTVAEHYPDQYPLFLLLARTGVRIGESLAVRWDDVDFTGRFIEIRRSIVRGHISKPKNGKTRRVDMSQHLADTLKRSRHECKKKGLKMGKGGLPQYLFMNSAGGMIDTHNWRRRVFKKALEKAELRAIRIHDLRHTYATIRINAGHNINDVSGQLGHSSLKMTLDTYTHWMPGKQKTEVDELDFMAKKEVKKVATN